MEIVLDTCAIINLINGNCLDKIFILNGYTFCVGEAVLEKEVLNDLQKTVLETFIEAGKIKVLSSEISLSAITNLRDKYNLGLGELECLALCMNSNSLFCSDDNKARKCSTNELGKSRVIGSLHLVRQIVLESIVKCFEALEYYNVMILKGGFLPKNLDSDYFCT